MPDSSCYVRFRHNFASSLIIESETRNKKAETEQQLAVLAWIWIEDTRFSSHSIKKNICSVLLLCTVCTFQLHVTLLLCHWPWKDFGKRLRLHGSAHSTSGNRLASTPPLSSSCVLRIETSFKMACWDQFPGSRQEGGDIKEVRRVTGVSSPNTSILSAPCASVRHSLAAAHIL